MPTIRLATPEEAPAVAAIYGPYCESTVISFEEAPPSVDEMARRITAIGATRPWIVLESRRESSMVGYAYASAHHDRAAYRWSVSTAIYISRNHHRRGAGRALYTTLFALLRALGYRQATAGITLPNPASVGLHAAFGFAPVGVYRRIGYKMGGWHDVAWYQAEIQPGSDHPAEPRSIRELVDTPQWDEAVARGLSHYERA
jgi:L-amino acid N-acyltransferase YncA